MFFNKHRLKSLFFVLISIQFVGCSNFTSSTKKEDQVVELKDDSLSCVSELAPDLKLYFEDALSDQKITRNLDCISNSLQTFADKTRGADPGLYQSEELRHFFNRYLLQNNQISEDFMTDIMNVKVLLVGGSRLTLTRAEINQLKEFIKLVDISLKELNGHWRSLLFHPSVKNVDFIRVTEVLKKSTERLLKSTQAIHAGFQYSQLLTFIENLNLFMGDKTTLIGAMKWLPLVGIVRDLFLNYDAALDTWDQWSESMNWTIDAYVFVLDYYYNIRSLAWSDYETWTVFPAFVDRGIRLVEESRAMKTQGLLKAEKIDLLIDELIRVKSLKTSIPADLIKSVYRKVIRNIVEGLSTASGQTLQISGLNRDHLAIIKEEWKVWSLSQQWIQTVFASKRSAISWDEFYDLAQKTSESIQVDKTKVGEIQYSAFEDWKKMMVSRDALLWDPNDRIILASDKSYVQVGYTGMLVANGLRTFSRLLMRGYGDRSNRSIFEQKITKDKFIDFEKDFKELGLQVGFLDPRTPYSSPRTMLEANLFTLAGDGDSNLTGAELYQIFGFLISGGRLTADRLYHLSLGADCVASKQLDVFKKQIVKEECLQTSLVNHFAELFSNVPGMVNYWNLHDIDEKQKIYEKLKQISLLHPGVSSNRFEYSEIRTLTTVVTYVESLMVSYDENQDGVLKTSELLKAMPRFQSFLESHSGALQRLPIFKETVMQTAFLFMLHHGRKPGANYADIRDAIKISSSLNDDSLPSVDQGHLLRLLSTLKTQIK